MLKIKSFQVDRLLVTGKHTSLLLERINFHKPHVASAAQAVFAVAFLPASAALHLHKKKNPMMFQIWHKIGPSLN